MRQKKQLLVMEQERGDKTEARRRRWQWCGHQCHPTTGEMPDEPWLPPHFINSKWRRRIVDFFVIWKVGERESRFMCFIHAQGRAGIITTYYSVIVTSHSLTSARVTHVPYTHPRKHPIYIVITFSACSQTRQPHSSKFNLQIHTCIKFTCTSLHSYM